MNPINEPDQTLRLYQKRVSNLLRSLPLGIIVIRAGGEIETANHAAVELFGYSATELVGRNVAILLQNSPWSTKDGEISFSTWCEQKSGAMVELEGRAKNGDIIPIDFCVRQLDPDNQELMVVVIQDVTERFLANKMKHDFYQMINHDVRSPLSNIVFFFSMLENRADCGVLTDFGRKQLSSASRNASRIVQLIDGLLELDRVESGAGNLLKEQVNIGNLIESSVDSIAARAQNNDVEILVETEDFFIHGDFFRLQQVLINLISNALDYTVSGKPITVSVTRLPGSVRVTVQDNGPGVPEEEKARLFDRFQQGSKTSSGGFGLGLAICKEIIKQHDGIIACENGVNGGSLFWFEIPQIEKNIEKKIEKRS